MSSSTQQDRAEWHARFESTPEQVRLAVQRVLVGQKQALADLFYQRMLDDPNARVYLTHDAVHARLHSAMQRWIETLFSCGNAESFVAAMAMQRHVGDVHARVDVPVNIVARGMRVLKARMSELVLGPDMAPEQAIPALRYVSDLVDLAFEVMSAAYVTAHERVARADEAYRMFAFGQNMSLERERQRAALLDWENQFFITLMGGPDTSPLPTLGESAFGLWLYHKASAVFEGSAELPALREGLQRIDEVLIPQCRAWLADLAHEEMRLLIKRIQNESRQIKFLLATLFEHFVEMESGKDALTQLLNRRFLPAVLAREAELCRRQGKHFALLLLDVDHFKFINDEFGHEAGDRILQQVAGVLLNSVRAGDFVFRYGGEEFLLLLVEVDPDRALALAEKIRKRVESEPFLIPNGRSHHVTVSVGGAIFDGHPDYQRLINHADEALYRAKSGGRNRSVMAA
ncbi:MAG: diguanylate cyclase [Halothiobacillaceae bacterium]|nr:diguanylate cyclase [Halothiobacillaceae bacterium]